MKKIRKIFFWTFIAFVLILDILLTMYLLSYNEYNVSVLNNKTLIVMNSKIGDYKKGDLLVVTKNPNKEYKVGDQIFFYDVTSKESIINYGKINAVNVNTAGLNSFIMSDSFLLTDQYLIGKEDATVVYAGVGSIIGLLASRWVFLFLVIVPILILFIYQLYLFFNELKKAKK